MNEASQKQFKPDFLQIPFEVVSCDGLRPTDLLVYGVLYWFEHLKDGRCTAGNPTIASYAMCKVRAVQAALQRLEKEGFIQCIFADKQKTQRLEIKTLVRYSRTAPREESVKEGSAELAYPEEKSPGEYAREFFNDKGSSIRGDLMRALCEANPGINEQALEAEMRKFIVYWTEPNKSGTKQKWQLQQTFDVKRRLYTWLSRAGTYNKANTKAGAGVTI